jgi:hypothetical protein
LVLLSLKTEKIGLLTAFFPKSWKNTRHSYLRFRKKGGQIAQLLGQMLSVAHRRAWKRQ